MSRILIIEDEEAIADLEKDYLELSGFEVEICNRVLEANVLYLLWDSFYAVLSRNMSFFA